VVVKVGGLLIVMLISAVPKPTLRQHLLACASLCLLFSLCAAAAGQTPDDDISVKVTSNLVQLNVGVADAKGRPVLDLTQSDFAVYEDGVRQTITHFEPTQTPFSLVLLLDMSGSTLNFRTSLKQAATRFIDALGPDDRLAVIAFYVSHKKGHTEDKIETLAHFTTDRKKIYQAINLAEGQGETNFYKALQYSINQLAQEEQRRKAIVVLTDGIDTDLDRQDRTQTANATSNEAAIASIKPEASPVLNAVLNSADRLGITIYPLALPSGDPKIFEPLTPPQAARYSAARARLEVLANRTGGQLHNIYRLEDMGRIYAQVAAEMRTLYSIAYQPSGKQVHNGNWHAITIQINRPELIARTRPGYFAK
jgi:VWFA-related protein